MTNFKERWKISSSWQFFVIILVFAITGSSDAIISKPILQEFGISKETNHFLIYFLFYGIIIFPIYQILLISIGFLFGQFKFFWNFERKLLRALKLGFIIQLFEKIKGTK